MGTPLYTSPEQWQQDAPLTVRSDLYSLGVLIGELLGSSSRSEAVQQVILRATANTSKQRFASVEELRQALDNALVREDGAVSRD